MCIKKKEKLFLIFLKSVLSGLRPDLIVEICSRALSFWTYQTTQESCFQEMLYKNLEEKYTQLEKQVQGVMRDAQSEITCENILYGLNYNIININLLIRTFSSFQFQL